MTSRVLIGCRGDGSAREETISIDRDELFREQFRQFLAATEGRPALIVPGQEGRRSVQIVEAVLESLQSRGPVEIQES
jgi:predicted dehydrogenase